MNKISYEGFRVTTPWRSPTPQLRAALSPSQQASKGRSAAALEFPHNYILDKIIQKVNFFQHLPTMPI
jgi:hypothetical protein